MRFPKRIKLRGRTWAVIYGKTRSYPLYRVAWTAGGRRHLKAHATYAEAKQHAEALARELAQGSQLPALTQSQARDAVAALDRLQEFYQSTGRRVSLLGAVAEYCEAAAKLEGRALGEAVEGYLASIGSVKRKDIREAVEEFIAADTPRTQANNGQRPQLAPDYANHRQLQLRKFADTFPNTAVCDLTKEHLDQFIGALASFAPKTRNHYRAAIKQWLNWCVRKDYLPRTHRLGEADGLRPERANGGEVEFYTPGEFAALLAHASDTLRPVLAVAGLAGLRSKELMRLDWADLRRVPGHVEVSAAKSKTRQRRLVEICPALAQWLDPHRDKQGKFWPGEERTFLEHYAEACKRAGVQRRKNGLRHSYATYLYALTANENLVAAQLGNSPAMIHAHYKGLATKAEAEKWFHVLPQDAVRP